MQTLVTVTRNASLATLAITMTFFVVFFSPPRICRDNISNRATTTTTHVPSKCQPFLPLRQSVVQPTANVLRNPEVPRSNLDPETGSFDSISRQGP
jgi:hypothetical protein